MSADLSIKRFFQAASDMLKQGRGCAAEQDLERAYVLLLRFTEFFINRLPEHPGWKSAEVADEKKKLKKECMSVFNEVEILKAELLGRYAAEAEVSFRHELATAAAARAAAEAAAAEAARAEAIAVAEAAEAEEARAVAAAADAAEERAEREAAMRAAAASDQQLDGWDRCGECSSDGITDVTVTCSL